MIAYAAFDAAKSFVATLLQVILYPLIVLLLALAVVIFLYGAFEFVLGAHDTSKRETGRKHMLWGIIGLVVMLSAQGILNIVINTFGI